MSKQQKHSHAIPIKHNLKPGPLWKYKHTKAELELLKRTNPHVYNGQYAQDPSPKGGGIFKASWWQDYQTIPTFDYRIITVDTAQKDKEENDYTVFQYWGAQGNRAFLIDQYRDKIEVHELERQAIAFWNKNLHAHAGILRGMFVEDKVSGTSLIQRIRNAGKFPIIPIPRHISKVVRAYNATPSIASGLVFLPEESEWLFDYKEEFRKITALMTHKHDDQMDATCDAIDIICLGIQYESPADAKDEILQPEAEQEIDNYSPSSNMNDYLEAESGLW